VAVTNLYELPSLVIDFGTATTFDIIDAQKIILVALSVPVLESQQRRCSQEQQNCQRFKS